MWELVARGNSTERRKDCISTTCKFQRRCSKLIFLVGKDPFLLPLRVEKMTRLAGKRPLWEFTLLTSSETVISLPVCGKEKSAGIQREVQGLLENEKARKETPNSYLHLSSSQWRVHVLLSKRSIRNWRRNAFSNKHSKAHC